MVVEIGFKSNVDAEIDDGILKEISPEDSGTRSYTKRESVQVGTDHDDYDLILEITYSEGQRMGRSGGGPSSMETRLIGVTPDGDIHKWEGGDGPDYGVYRAAVANPLQAYEEDDFPALSPPWELIDYEWVDEVVGGVEEPEVAIMEVKAESKSPPQALKDGDYSFVEWGDYDIVEDEVPVIDPTGETDISDSLDEGLWHQEEGPDQPRIISKGGGKREAMNYLHRNLSYIRIDELLEKRDIG